MAFAGGREEKKEIIGKIPTTACLSFSPPQLFGNNLWGGQTVFFLLLFCTGAALLDHRKITYFWCEPTFIPVHAAYNWRGGE